MTPSALLTLSLLTACTQRADEATAPESSGPWMADVHTHINVGRATALRDLVDALNELDVQHNLVMPFPAAQLDDPVLDEAEVLLAFLESEPRRFGMLYGGWDLQPLLVTESFDSLVSAQELYPCGLGASYKGQDIGARLEEAWSLGSDARLERFQQAAEAAAASGHYAGFGELAPLHFARHPGHPAVSYPADHDWLLWLAGLAAAHDMTLELHLELTEGPTTYTCPGGGRYTLQAGDTLAELDELLRRSPDTRVVWSHAGWSNTGLAQPALLDAMLREHDKLWLNLKVEQPESEELGAAWPLEDDGRLREDWSALLTEHSQRIMLATDAKHWQSGASPAQELSATMEHELRILEQLPLDARLAIGAGTARALYGWE